MSIFDIDFNVKGVEIIPPDKRDIGLMFIIKAVIKPIQWLRDFGFGSYKKGAIGLIPDWSAGTYNLFDRVIYNKQVFESLISNNSDEPGLVTSWRMYQGNFLGFDRRMQFSSNKLLFEFALNLWFRTTFRQPTSNEASPDFYLPKSDIYLVTNEIPVSVFRVGFSEDESSSVGLATSSEPVYDDYDFAAVYGLTIMIPIALWNSLNSDASKRDGVVRSFADKCISAGVLYNIQTY